MRVESLKSIGDVHLREERYRLALQQYQEADAIDPRNPEIKFRIGLIYGDFLKRVEEAIQYYTEAIRLKPDYSDAYNNLGVLYARQERWDEAIAMFHKALENLYYTTPERAYYNLGEVHEAKGDPTRAIEYYQTSIELKRQYVEPYVRIGLIHAAAGQHGPALQAFQQARAIMEKREPKRGRSSEAEMNAYRVTLAGIHYHMGLSLVHVGRVPDAREAFQKALEISPEEEMQKQVQRELKALPAP
jgi:tetratricopeptide (TPR) repeat protein